jgi:hypothetical protein
MESMLVAKQTGYEIELILARKSSITRVELRMFRHGSADNGRYAWRIRYEDEAE